MKKKKRRAKKSLIHTIKSMIWFTTWCWCRRRFFVSCFLWAILFFVMLLLIFIIFNVSCIKPGRLDLFYNNITCLETSMAVNYFDFYVSFCIVTQLLLIWLNKRKYANNIVGAFVPFCLLYQFYINPNT